MTTELEHNMILMTDAYKCTHWLQYPEGTQHVYSYLESRGHDEGFDNYTVWFGLQYYLKRFFEGVRITQDDIEETAQFCVGVFGHDRYFNRAGWQRIVDVHNGRIPLQINALPEGSVVPTRTPLMTLVNTDPELPWVTNWAETLLMKVWYPTSVATLSTQIREMISTYAQTTGGEVSPFHLNDFGYRGVSSEESGQIGGMAHLTAFKGTDTLGGIVAAQRYYGIAEGDTYGHSVMASEHSTTTIYGRTNEVDAMIRFIQNSGDGAIVSLVSDSYDYFKILGMLANPSSRLHAAILDHGKRGGRVVIRPDSGDPVEMAIQGLNAISEGFGYERNDLGYRVLPPHIGIIYGDGLDFDMIENICQAMSEEDFAVDGRNVIFGMGGGLLQSTDRDTFQFALKCSAAMNADGDWVPVYKDPVTSSSKGSKRGRLAVVRSEENQYETVVLDEQRENVVVDCLLEPVFLNGNLLRDENLTQIRERINTGTAEFHLNPTLSA